MSQTTSFKILNFDYLLHTCNTLGTHFIRLVQINYLESVYLMYFTILTDVQK